MGILTGQKILSNVNCGLIKIDPFNREQLNPNSYNLRLGNDFAFYKANRKLTIYENPEPDGTFNIEDGCKFVIQPGELVLGQTMEYTETDHYIPLIEGRSSIARQFCSIHFSAGFGDIGFKGHWTLEIVPMAPMTLWPGMEICQIYYHTPDGSISDLYQGRYNKNDGVQTVIKGGV